jgi:hypothetical protein
MAPNSTVVPSYNAEQILFSLSMFSNYASMTRGDSDSLTRLLTEDLNKIFPNDTVIHFIGQWEIVWGPVVYVPDGIQQQQANASYIVEYKGPQPNSGPPIPRYVIATAGTNPYSFFGWFVEDFEVVNQVDWPWAQPAGMNPKIAEGTSKGMKIITETMEFEGANVFDFLSQMTSETDEAFTIATVGHSLGGALSPTLALEMVDRQNEWDPNGIATVVTSPSAGPSAGNADFATYYNNRLGSRTNRIWNKIDVVPHAWPVHLLREIPSLYVPDIPQLSLLETIVELIIWRTRNGNYTQIVGDGNQLQGQYDPSAVNPDLPDVMQFAQQAGYQHTTAYHKLLGVEPLLELTQQLIGKDAKEMAGYASETEYFQDLYEHLQKLADSFNNR